MNAPTPSRSLTLPARLRILASEGLTLFAIAIGCLVVFAIGFFVWVKTGLINHYIPARWFGLLFWTCALLWVILRQFKEYLRRGRFWGSLLGLLLLHVFAFVIVLKLYPEWRMAWFMLVFLVEGPLIMTALRSLVSTGHHR